MGCDMEQQGMGMETPEAKKSLAVVVGGGWWWSEIKYSVCPRPFVRLREARQVGDG